jgi:hypothetical protein
MSNLIKTLGTNYAVAASQSQEAKLRASFDYFSQAIDGNNTIDQNDFNKRIMEKANYYRAQRGEGRKTGWHTLERDDLKSLHDDVGKQFVNIESICIEHGCSDFYSINIKGRKEYLGAPAIEDYTYFLVEAMDRDGDKKVSWDEFKTYMNQPS